MWCFVENKNLSQETIQIIMKSFFLSIGNTTYFAINFARSFAGRNKDRFWRDVKRLQNRGASSNAPVVDGVCGNYNIANRFASKFQSLLNRHHLYPKGRLADLIHSTLSESHLNDIFFLSKMLFRLSCC